MQSIANRKGEILAVHHHASRVSIEAIVPTRGLIGFETDFVNQTRGEGIMSHLFREYAPFKGDMGGRGRGVMVSMEPGVSTAYALNNIQERGRLFIGPQEDVYEGMIVGENRRPEDLPVNPCKEKHLTNMRSQGDGKGIQLEGRGRGVMVSMESGVSTAYALNNIQERGRLFIGPQEDVYEGMIVGENARPEDLPVNPCKAKHLTNMRSQGDGKGIQLEAPLCMSLERAIEYIDIDEYVEATPKSLRLLKRILDATARKRAMVIAA